MKLDFEQVKAILPQRHPFIMIDRVLELEPGKKVIAEKNISGNEEIFEGHFPNKAILPGAYIIEAMAQAGIILFCGGKPITDNNKTFFLSSTKVRFLSPVVPGDQLIIELELIKQVAAGGIAKAWARVEDKLAAKGELAFAAKAA
ncbi:3-hydroxyacyl-ACP dehydratase FabZ [Candidatus Margulisiibacteriota bacterium]